LGTPHIQAVDVNDAIAFDGIRGDLQAAVWHHQTFFNDRCRIGPNIDPLPD